MVAGRFRVDCERAPNSGEIPRNPRQHLISALGRTAREREKPLPTGVGSGSEGGCQYFTTLFANAGAGAVVSSLGADTLDGSPSEV